MIKYRIYPTLLDEFQRYLNQKVTLENMLNRINRVRDFDDQTLARMKKGVAFEAAVLKGGAHTFDSEIITEVRELLPKQFTSQFSVKFNYKEVQIYGFADVVGQKRIIDIKTTSSFNETKYQNGFQNLYLFGLKEYGFETMEYLVYDFEKVRHLVYSLEEVDFEQYFQAIDQFVEFLEKYKTEISDPKIFVNTANGGLFA